MRSRVSRCVDGKYIGCLEKRDVRLPTLSALYFRCTVKKVVCAMNERLGELTDKIHDLEKFKLNAERLTVVEPSEIDKDHSFEIDRSESDKSESDKSESDKDYSIGNQQMITTIIKQAVTISKLEKRLLTSNAKPRRKPLNAALRMTLWNDSFGETSGTGQCHCCNRVVTQQAFEGGHVISVADGGSDHLSNLRVVCRKCNSSMGTENMLEFRMKYFSR